MDLIVSHMFINVFSSSFNISHMFFLWLAQLSIMVEQSSFLLLEDKKRTESTFKLNLTLVIYHLRTRKDFRLKFDPLT